MSPGYKFGPQDWSQVLTTSQLANSAAIILQMEHEHNPGRRRLVPDSLGQNGCTFCLLKLMA